MKSLRNILFFVFAVMLVCKLVVPDSFLIEVEDLVELSDDCESEEDKENEDSEIEWKWKIESDFSLIPMTYVSFLDRRTDKNSGELSDGERIIFSPPPENVI